VTAFEFSVDWAYSEKVDFMHAELDSTDGEIPRPVEPLLNKFFSK
jgi:hypothetical protein